MCDRADARLLVIRDERAVKVGVGFLIACPWTLQSHFDFAGLFNV